MRDEEGTKVELMCEFFCKGRRERQKETMTRRI